MGAFVKDMDDFAINTSLYPRRFPSRLPILVVGHHPAKTGQVSAKFVTFNFSFILKGRGKYRLSSQSFDVKAPCVITQWPGMQADYGPSRVWEEVFLMYDHRLMKELLRRGFARRDKPAWHIGDVGPVVRRLQEIRELLKNLDAYGKADLLDAACENMVLASLAGESRAPMDDNERAIHAVRSQVEARFLEDLDIDTIALDHGLSGSTFRRHWARLVGPPPARFVIELRLRQASRMLLETDQAVRAIAARCGFVDALYFSRRFRDFLGLPPTEYRRRHREALFGR
jgi:AraC-like DNA-binding protein